MSLTDRDKKIVIVLLPLLALLGYWFLLFSPKREEAARAADELAKQEQRRDAALEQARGLDSMKADFASEYAELVRLGKAIPSSVDMPSLLVQLDKAARGTGIKFKRVAAGQRQSAPAQQGANGSSTPAAAGGTPAQSAPGKGAEAAGNAAGATNGASAKSSGAGAQGQGVTPADAQTSTPSKQGGVPIGGGTATAGGAGSGSPSSGAPGLDSVPLEFDFEGSFFDLADLFHRLKRFVQVANKGVLVRGRLLTIDTVSFSSGEQLFPKLKAEVTATVYLAPKAEGATAGATPQGPAGATAAGSPSPPSQGSATQPSATTSPAP
ncbi:MAG: type 4a pilus biogenesis protein PilO [Thermoleophilaceae bacterium]